MALTGNALSSWYKDLFQIDNANKGFDATIRQVKSGDGTGSALYTSKDHFKVQPSKKGTATVDFQNVAGTTLLGVDTTNSKLTGDGLSTIPGAIIGMTVLDPVTDASYTLTTGYAEISTSLQTSYTAPPSGNVEIEFSIFRDASTSNRIAYFALYDYNGSAYITSNPSGNTKTKSDYADETDDSYLTQKWYLTGLTALSTNYVTIYAKTSATTSYLRWGGSTDDEYPPAILKITGCP